MNNEAIANQISEVVAQNSANQSIVTALSTRAALDSTSEVSARAMLRFALELSQTDLCIDNAHNIALRNRNALTKCAQILKTIRTHVDELDKYSRAIVHNMRARKNKALDSKQQNASLSIAIELDTMRARDERLHKATSTASTQRSSSSYALHACNVADYNAKDNTLTLRDSDEAKALDKFVK